MKLPKKIPEKFRSLFWDVDFDKFDPSKYPYQTIQRILDKGDLDSVRWARKSFGDNLIKKTLEINKDFNQRTGNFWRLFLNIPTNKVACLSPHYLTMRKALWPF